MLSIIFLKTLSNFRETLNFLSTQVLEAQFFNVL